MPQVGKQCPLQSPGLGDPPLHQPFRSSGRECFGPRNWCSFQIPHHVSVATGKSESVLVREETGLLPLNFSTTGLTISLRAGQSSPRAFKAAPAHLSCLPPSTPTCAQTLGNQAHVSILPPTPAPDSPVEYPPLSAGLLPTLQAPSLLCPSLESPS